MKNTSGFTSQDFAELEGRMMEMIEGGREKELKALLRNNVNVIIAALRIATEEGKKSDRGEPSP